MRLSKSFDKDDFSKDSSKIKKRKNMKRSVSIEFNFPNDSDLVDEVPA